MRPFSVLIIVLAVLFNHPPLLADSSADTPDKSLEILAQRGKGVVTQDMFVARAEKIPAKLRQETLRNGDRFEEVVNIMVLQAQLAADAREAGLDKQAKIIQRMKLAAEWELAEAWLEHFADTQPGADYAQLASEYYQLHPDEFLTPETIDVSHILISTRERSEQEAHSLAVTIRQQLVEDPARFDELVKQYSEDPSAASNQGSFTGIKKGTMVAAFEDTAFALGKDEISPPVKTEYGFHIIRLDKHFAGEVIEYEGVKEEIMEFEREQHLARIREEYLRSLNTQELVMSEAAMREMIRRVFDEDFIQWQTGSTENSE